MSFAADLVVLINYLGHAVSVKQVETDPDVAKCISDCHGLFSTEDGFEVLFF